MKMHWLKISLLATLGAWMLPGSASAGWRDRVERREARYEDRSDARTPPAAPPRTYWNGRAYVPAPPVAVGPVDRLLFVTPRERSYYRRYGWPAEPPRGAVVYRPLSSTPAPRSFVERSAEPLPALHEPTLALEPASGVVQTSATESLPQPSRQPTPAFNAQPPAEIEENFDARKEWPQVRQAENQQWREARIKELEARIEALEATQASPPPQPQPLPGPGD
jgi:hypothetical protein